MLSHTRGVSSYAQFIIFSTLAKLFDQNLDSLYFATQAFVQVLLLPGCARLEQRLEYLTQCVIQCLFPFIIRVIQFGRVEPLNAMYKAFLEMEAEHRLPLGTGH